MTWRPLSERGIAALTTALNNSPIVPLLLDWCGQLGITGINQFRRLGFNRARHARLVWQAVVDHRHPIEAIAEVQLPTIYGASGSDLRFTLDILGRVRPVPEDPHPPGMAAERPMPTWRLSVPRLYTLVDGLLAALTDSGVMSTLADLAAIDPVVVPQPPDLDFLTGPSMEDLLNLLGLTTVEDAGTSHGANLIADPALDLRHPPERHEQVDSWLLQVGLDAGLLGMERLLAQYHHQASGQSNGGQVERT